MDCYRIVSSACGTWRFCRLAIQPCNYKTTTSKKSLNLNLCRNMSHHTHRTSGFHSLMKSGIMLLLMSGAMGRARICARLKGDLHCENRCPVSVLQPGSYQMNDSADFEPFVHLTDNAPVGMGDLVVKMISESYESAVEENRRSPATSQGSDASFHDCFLGIRAFMEKYSMAVLQTRFTSLYCVLLLTYPMITKSTTAAFIGGAGDLLAQLVEIHVFAQQKQGKMPKRYDLTRTTALAIEGLLASGPMMHYAYKILESIIPTQTPDPNDDLYEWLAAAFHVFIDAVVMDAFSVGTILITTAMFEGRRIESSTDFMKDYIPAVKVSWLSSLCFSPIQCALFRFLQVDYRVLAMNIQDVLWNGAVSYMLHRSSH